MRLAQGPYEAFTYFIYGKPRVEVEGCGMSEALGPKIGSAESRSVNNFD